MVYWSVGSAVQSSVNLRMTFVNILGICEHLWPNRSLLLLRHTPLQSKYFVQPDLGESPATQQKGKIISLAIISEEYVNFTFKVKLNTKKRKGKNYLPWNQEFQSFYNLETKMYYVFWTKCLGQVCNKTIVFHVVPTTTIS